MPSIVLDRFMIFNSHDGQSEGRETDKLLFHWTRGAENNKINLTEQIDDICLCDASINTSIRLNNSISIRDSGSLDENDAGTPPKVSQSSIAENESHIHDFNSDGRSLTLNFESKTLIIVEVEPKQSIWLAALVRSDTMPRELNTSAPLDTDQQIFHTAKACDSDSIPTSAIEQIARNIYKRFCLLNGTFGMIINDIKRVSNAEEKEETLNSVIREKLRSTCERYFNHVLADIHLNSIVTNISLLYNLINYLDLNPLTLMKVNSFINHLVSIDAEKISHTIAIFNDQLLWSSLNKYDTQLVYNYLVAVPIRDALQEEISREMDRVRRIGENMPIYLTTACDDLNDLDKEISEVSIEEDTEFFKNELTRHYLTLFRSSNNLTLGLILKEPDQFDLIQRCENLLTSDSRLGVVPLASLAQSVGQNFLKTNFTSSGLASSSSSSSRRRAQSSSSSDKVNQPPVDRKYLYIDRISLSASWSHNMDSIHVGKDKISLSTMSEGGKNFESTKKNRKLRLAKYLLDLEPEMETLKRKDKKASGVEEFIAKTTSDSWLTVMNSTYRSIYSIYKMRNVGLTEAQQYAIRLKSSIASSRYR